MNEQFTTISNHLAKEEGESGPTSIYAPRYKPKIVALLIGIDKYQHSLVPNLTGCVNDCEDVKAWLNQYFQTVHLKSLVNEDATRINILTAIDSLATSNFINDNDPILIYFAGHGSQVPPLPEWKLPSERYVQMCVPYDFTPGIPTATSGSGILDRELSESLAKVGNEKGDNMVVVLDSCHSASGTRDERLEDRTIRGIELPTEYARLALLPKSMFTANYAPNSSRASSTTPNNHVLLAACREDWTAGECWRYKADQKSEVERRGVFTHALFQKLREKESLSMTYDELILSLGNLRQYPHCDGINKDRFIFSQDRKDSNFYPIQLPEDGDGLHRLQLGLSNGLQNTDRFLVFQQPDFSSAYVGEAEVVRLRNFDSHLRVPPGGPPMAFAIRAIPSPFVRITVNADVRQQLGPLPWFSTLGVELVSDGDADLELVHDDVAGWVKFKFLSADSPLTETFLHPWPLNTIGMVQLFQQMGHFYYHLNHRSPSQVQLVNVTLMQLDSKTLTEVGEGLTPGFNGYINVGANDDTNYGIKITNESNRPIFFSLFYFSQKKFRIDPLYNPPTVADGEATPCLTENESKTVGYGNPGDIPFSFTLAAGEKNDFGYLVLFFSDQYLDLLHITRPDIFWPKDEFTDHRRDLLKGRKKRAIPCLNIPAQSPDRFVGVLKIPIFQAPTVQH